MNKDFTPSVTVFDLIVGYGWRMLFEMSHGIGILGPKHLRRQHQSNHSLT